MNKEKAVLIIMCLFMCVSSFAQENSEKKSFWDKYWAEIGAGSSGKYHKLKPYTSDVNFGLDITKRFYMYISDENILCLRKKDGERNYFKSYNFGGGVGYSIFAFKSESKDSGLNIDMKAQVTTSVGNADWKNTAYTIGMYYRFTYSCTDFQPYFGFGYKYIDSRETGLSNHSRVPYVWHTVLAKQPKEEI